MLIAPESAKRDVHPVFPVPSLYLWGPNNLHHCDVEFTYGEDRVLSYCGLHFAGSAAGDIACVMVWPQRVRGMDASAYNPPEPTAGTRWALLRRMLDVQAVIVDEDRHQCW